MDPLPPELLPLIASHLDSKELQSFALTCRCINEVARKQMTWKIKGHKEAEAFLDLLLISREPWTKASLVPSLIHRLDVHASLVEKHWIPPSGDFDEWVALVCSILDLCGSLRYLTLAAATIPTVKLSDTNQDGLMGSLAKLTNLEQLYIDTIRLNLFSFDHFATNTHAPLKALTVSLQCDQASSVHLHPFCFPISTQAFNIFGTIDDTTFSSLARHYWVGCRRLALVLLCPVDPQVLAEALTVPKELRGASVNCMSRNPIDDTARTPMPLRGRLTAFFMIRVAGSSSISTTRIGVWVNLKQDLLDSMLKSDVNDVWVRKGADMGREEEAEVMHMAEKHGKKVVWF